MKPFAFAACLALISSPAFAGTIAPGDAQAHIGQTVTVEGTVAAVSTSRRGARFLDFGGRYPNETFAVVIFADDAGQFGDIDAFEGKTVDVTGRITSYRGRPEIIVKSRNQLRAK